MSRWRRQQRKRAGKQRRNASSGRWVIYEPGTHPLTRAFKALMIARLVSDFRTGRVALLPPGCALEFIETKAAKETSKP